MRISFATLFVAVALAGFAAATPSANAAVSLPLDARALQAYPECVCGKDAAGNKVCAGCPSSNLNARQGVAEAIGRCVCGKDKWCDDCELDRRTLTAHPDCVCGKDTQGNKVCAGCASGV